MAAQLVVWVAAAGGHRLLAAAAVCVLVPGMQQLGAYHCQLVTDWRPGVALPRVRVRSLARHEAQAAQASLPQCALRVPSLHHCPRHFVIVISGFIVAKTFCRKIDENNALYSTTHAKIIYSVSFYIKRFFRLTPPVLAALLFYFAASFVIVGSTFFTSFAWKEEVFAIFTYQYNFFAHLYII
ncbi:MAG: hypothetical protein EOO68_19380 [Moraxellaceae bacterium]|nr:MAG: hypothetical protein EOO68_19380 [Moraxellaceae bacterium]